MSDMRLRAPVRGHQRTPGVVPVSRDGAPHTGTGHVIWPTDLNATGEGGMWVLAVVPGDLASNGGRYVPPAQFPDGFERCHADTLPQLSMPDSLIDPDPEAGEPYIRCPHCDALTPWDYQRGASTDRCPACQQHLPQEVPVALASPAGPGPAVHCRQCGEWAAVENPDQVPEECAACGAPYEKRSRDCVVQRFPLQESLFPGLYDYATPRETPESLWSVEFLAVVCLGTSNGTWADPVTHDRWVCAREDLTDKGRALLDSLEELYGRPVQLLTLVDT